MISRHERRALGLNRHHRKPRSLGGSSKDFNISLVPPESHAAWHKLFKNYEPDVIATIINETWLDPDFEFVCVKRPRKRR